MGYDHSEKVFWACRRRGLCALLPVASVAKEAKKEDWRVRENLVSGSLVSCIQDKRNSTRELSSVSDVISDMRDIRAVSAGSAAVQRRFAWLHLDRKLELCEKSYQVLPETEVTVVLPRRLPWHEHPCAKWLLPARGRPCLPCLTRDDVQRFPKCSPSSTISDSLWRSIDTLHDVVSHRRCIVVPGGAGTAGCGFEGEFSRSFERTWGEQTFPVLRHDRRS